MPQNIGDNRIIETGIARITPRDASRLSRYLVRKDDIVYSRRGDVERRALVLEHEDGWLCGTGCLRVRLGEKGVDPKYASYYLGHPSVREWIVRHAHGATMPNLNTSILAACPFVVPPVAEQRRIASILGALDDRIELNRQMNRTLEEMAQAIFTSWFIDFDGHDDLGESELGLIPRGWEVGPLGDIVDVHGGGTPSTKIAAYWDEGIIHWATPKDLSPLTSPVLLSTERKITSLGLGTISSGLLPSGTLLLSSRAPVGYLAIADVPVAVNQGFIAIPPGGKLSNLYMLRWLAANMERIKAHAGGTTFQEISKRSFRPITAIVPPAIEVARFDSVSGPMLKRVVGNEKQSATLTALRDTLLPKLISGEIRVPEAEEILEDVL